MADNVMERLRCQTTAHGFMERRLADRQPYAGPYSVWVCLTCGVLAIHLEWCGDIHWYEAIRDAGLEADGSHLATCGYCPARFECSCGQPGKGHMCPRCDAAQEESKMIQLDGDAGERADEARQAEAYDASHDPNATVDTLAGEDLPW